MNRTADPFIVTVEPKGDDEPIHYNKHNGQEFNLVLEGRMLINIEGKEIILNQGDSIYFNSKLPHGMKSARWQNGTFSGSNYVTTSW